MKKLIPTVALVLMVPALASAQADHPYWAQGYFFLGPAVTSSVYSCLPSCGITEVDVNTGFGAEALVYKGLGLGGEVGYAGPGWYFGRLGMTFR